MPSACARPSTASLACVCLCPCSSGGPQPYSFRTEVAITVSQLPCFTTGTMDGLFLLTFVTSLCACSPVEAQPSPSHLCMRAQVGLQAVLDEHAARVDQVQAGAAPGGAGVVAGWPEEPSLPGAAWLQKGETSLSWQGKTRQPQRGQRGRRC